MIDRQCSSSQLGRRLTAAEQYRATRAALSTPWHQSSSHSRSSGQTWPIRVPALRPRRAGPVATSRRGVLDRERARLRASAAVAFAGVRAVGPLAHGRNACPKHKFNSLASGCRDSGGGPASTMRLGRLATTGVVLPLGCSKAARMSRL